jgi:glyoxylase-like metal-dependent hydrolase (beta-lactamase superfamily II)
MFDRVTVGDYEIFALHDGVQDCDRMADAFPVADQDQLMAYKTRYPGVYGNDDLWRLTIRAWLIRHPGGQILLDTGIGPETAPGFEWFHAAGELHAALAEVGTSAAEIPTVVLSHVHDDHIGGTATGDGKPAFPNASYMVQRADVDFLRGLAESGSEEHRVSWDVSMAPLEAAGVLVTLDGDTDIAPGIRVHHRPGHTPGHQVLRIGAADGSRILLSADTFNHPAQFAHPDWPSGPDNDPETAAATRRDVLAELATEAGTMIAPTHFGESFGYLVAGVDHEPSWEPVRT